MEIRSWWKSLLLALVVIVPIAVIVAFNATEIPGNVAPETKILEPTFWFMTVPKLEPDHSFSINETVQNAYSSNETSTAISIGISILHYLEDWSEFPADYGDCVTFKVNITISSKEQVESLSLKFYAMENNTSAYTSTAEDLGYNITVTKTRYLGTNSTEAYIEAQTLGSTCGLSTQVEWILDNANSENHALKATLEVLCYNGTTRTNIVLPVILELHASG